jgi:hypothetical protein
MWIGGRRAIGLVAIYAIALHVILWSAIAPTLAANQLDPFSIICHSEADAPPDQAPDNPAPAPGHACDHCNLCSVSAPPALAPIFAGQHAPVRLLQILQPTSSAVSSHLTTTPKLARGPPSFA